MTKEEALAELQKIKQEQEEVRALVTQARSLLNEVREDFAQLNAAHDLEVAGYIAEIARLKKENENLQEWAK